MRRELHLLKLHGLLRQKRFLCGNRTGQAKRTLQDIRHQMRLSRIFRTGIHEDFLPQCPLKRAELILTQKTASIRVGMMEYMAFHLRFPCEFLCHAIRPDGILLQSPIPLIALLIELNIPLIAAAQGITKPPVTLEPPHIHRLNTVIIPNCTLLHVNASYFPAFIRLMALNSAWIEAVMISVSSPAPQLIFPSAPVIPIYAIARDD